MSDTDQITNSVLLGELRQGFRDVSTRLEKLEGRVTAGEETLTELFGHHRRREKLVDTLRAGLVDKAGFVVAGLALAHLRWP